MFDIEVVINSLPLLAKGLVLTVQLLVSSLLAGAIIALISTLMLISQKKWLYYPARWYSYFFRGTPALVQIYMIYYGVGQFTWVQENFLWIFFQEPFFCAWLTLSLNTGAYSTEILRGAIANISRGQHEGGRSLGLNAKLIFCLIIFPQAIRNALPAYSNEVIAQLHTTAIVSTITLVDITGAARYINGNYYTPFEAFIPAAVFYLLCTFILVSLFRQWEKHWRKSSRR